MRHKQLDTIKRHLIAHYRQSGYSIAQIAEAVAVHRSIIYRELQRNSCNDGAYRPSKAQRRTNGRRSRSRRNTQFTDKDWRLIKRFIRRKYSPDQIAMRLRLLCLISVSHETIYRYIKCDKAKGGNLFTHLRHQWRKRRKRYGTVERRGKLANKRSIDARPDYINNRKTIGHWEIDTVMGSTKACLVTMVERKTGYCLIGKLKDRTAAPLGRRVLELIRTCPQSVKSITADNGTEYCCSKVEEQANLKFYFAHPYHSWERGTNENTNGLIRQYLPKGTNLADVTQGTCNYIAKELTDRPRKRLRYRTPNKARTRLNVAIQM
jgi:IS30 family transposase